MRARKWGCHNLRFISQNRYLAVAGKESIKTFFRLYQHPSRGELELYVVYRQHPPKNNRGFFIHMPDILPLRTNKSSFKACFCFSICLRGGPVCPSLPKEVAYIDRAKQFVQKMSVTAPPATRGKRQMIRKREVNH